MTSRSRPGANLVMLLLSGPLVLGGTLLSCSPGEPELAWQPALHERNAREGSAAQTWFEVVSLAGVPGHRSWSPSSSSVHQATYVLDPDTDSYEVWGHGLGHLRFVTLVRNDDASQSPFVFDLYVHGDPLSAEHLAVRIPDLDIRKFLHQSSVPLSDDQGLARWNAYFAEFSRKTKVFYQQSTRGADSPFSEYGRGRIRDARDELRALETQIRSMGSRAAADRVVRAFEALQGANGADLGVVETNLTRALAGLEAAARLHETPEPQVAKDLRQVISGVVELSTLRKISKFKMTNNCREPGNYEIAIEDWLGRPLIQGSFAFPPGAYDEILMLYDGFSIQALGTGVRISETLRDSDWRRYWKSILPWRRIKSVPIGKISALTSARTGRRIDPEAASESQRGEIQVIRGRIPFEDYEIEVRHKSAFRSAAEPLSYVRVDPDKVMPRGFKSPDGTGAFDYWASPHNAGKSVPHRFAYFEDLVEYEVLLSGFESNGVYIGKSDLKDYDKTRGDGRWSFDYRYLSRLQSYELRGLGEGRLEIRLHSNGDPSDAVNFLFGNVALRVGESAEYLFGIGAQPLISDYNDNVLQRTPLYAVAYASDGTILDHHDTAIGVERVYIERLAPSSYRIRLVAHERILPVWEGVI